MQQLNAINWFSKYRKESVILFLFAIIYCSISLVNHYNFRTNALDLGMFNHALYSFSHGKMNYFTLDLSGNDPIYFADHFSPITFLYTPFYYIFGSWTLLIIQILSILFGALGCYKVVKLKLPDFNKHYLFLIFFLGQWAIISALAFDFHNNVVAAMLVPWFYYFYKRNEKFKTLIFFILILIAKENMALWMVFIMLGILFQDGFKTLIKSFKNYLKFEIPLLIIAFIYFYCIVSFVMPALSKGEAVNQIGRFAHLGSSVGEIVKTLVFHPWETFKMFFQSTSEDPISFGIKKELHLVVFFSGGFALLLRPAYLIMLIPIYAQKLLSSNIALWGINGQYSIEFTPIIALALIDLVARIDQPKRRVILLTASCFAAVLVNFITLKDRTSFWYDSVVHDFTSKAHYDSGGLDLKFIHSELNKIPDEIPISVSTCFAPQLANRDKLYHFPVTNDAEMLVLLKDKRSLYPIDRTEFDRKIKELVDTKQYRITLDKLDLLILKKNK